MMMIIFKIIAKVIVVLALASASNIVTTHKCKFIKGRSTFFDNILTPLMGANFTKKEYILSFLQSIVLYVYIHREKIKTQLKKKESTALEIPMLIRC